jgi:beta-phosphoglucomutase-like phosphatase (HAD superfamily)
MNRESTPKPTLLCDADGNLFPSEEPAFAASVTVVNDFLREHGVGRRLDPDEQRRASTGKNFRAFLETLRHDVAEPLSQADLNRWVATECDVVSNHLATCLTPDPAVLGPLNRLADRFRLVAVSSSAASRLDRCFEVTGLAGLIPTTMRFSAEDSLPVPTSKPDPAIYRHACRELGVSPEDAVAVEDSAPGVQSAVAAGVTTIGNLQFVPAHERTERARDLYASGAALVVSSWSELEVATN